MIFFINLRELQVWVNGSNILSPNFNTLIGYFALWTDKETDLGSFNSNTRPVSMLYNDILNVDTETASNSSNN